MKPSYCRTLALTAAIGSLIAGLALPAAAQQKSESRAESYRNAAAEAAAKNRAISESRVDERFRRRVIEDAGDERLGRGPIIGVLLALDEVSGVRIAGVTPGGSAESAGLRSGDRLVKIDGKRLVGVTPEFRVREARELLTKLAPDKPVTIAYFRDGKVTSAEVTPKIDQRIFILDGRDMDSGMQAGNVVVLRRDGQGTTADAASLELVPAGTPLGIAPEIRREIVRLGSDCTGEDCKVPVLAEAFRWNGLNLASVDARLGRYFGTDKGVLVLSAGKDLEGLQAGDVIRSIDGREVGTPREAMDALRAQPAGGKVAIGYLRDRTAATAQVNVPKAMTFALPRAAAAPRVPGEPGAIEHRKMVFVGTDGKVQSYEYGDHLPPPPPPAPPAPPVPPPPPPGGR